MRITVKAEALLSKESKQQKSIKKASLIFYGFFRKSIHALNRCALERGNSFEQEGGGCTGPALEKKPGPIHPPP